MSYYSLSDTVNSCSDFIIDSCIGGFVRNPIIASIIVTFITIAIINVTGNKNLKRSFVIGTAINTSIFICTYRRINQVFTGVKIVLLNLLNGLIKYKKMV